MKNIPITPETKYFFVKTIYKMPKIYFEPNFDADTWCEGADLTVETRPVKKLVCAFIDILQFVTPATRFIELLVGIIRDFIIENQEYTDIFIILSPVIPIGLLTGYFLNTL